LHLQGIAIFHLTKVSGEVTTQPRDILDAVSTSPPESDSDDVIH